MRRTAAGGRAGRAGTTAPHSGAPAGDTAPARRVRLALAVQYAVSGRTLPSRAALARWMRAALAVPATVTARFVGEREGRRLNAQFRGRDYATNVLTFVYDQGSPLVGDLVLCTPVLRREAREQGKELADHIAHLVVHGMLHLQGFDHDDARSARAMERREASILVSLGVPDPYAVPYAGRAGAGAGPGRRGARPATRLP
jgi:probable rRNA maturation factor